MWVVNTFFFFCLSLLLPPLCLYTLDGRPRVTESIPPSPPPLGADPHANNKNLYGYHTSHICTIRFLLSSHTHTHFFLFFFLRQSLLCLHALFKYIFSQGDNSVARVTVSFTPIPRNTCTRTPSPPPRRCGTSTPRGSLRASKPSGSPSRIRKSFGSRGTKVCSRRSPSRALRALQKQKQKPWRFILRAAEWARGK